MSWKTFQYPKKRFEVYAITILSLIHSLKIIFMVTKRDIIGTWILVDRGTDDPVNGELSKSRYGEDSKGLLIIPKEGWMNAAISWKNRPALTCDPSWHTDAAGADRL